MPGSDVRAGHDDKVALKREPTLQGGTRWQRKTGGVTHVFTDFPLERVVYTAKVAARTRAPCALPPLAPLPPRPRRRAASGPAAPQHAGRRHAQPAT